MPSVSHSAIVPYSAKQMFDLVDNVNDYQAFLPWCSESIEHHRDQDEVKASLEIQAPGIKKTFTTVNRRQVGKMIEIRLVDGPFHHLEGFWQFEALSDEQCRISLDLEFEFSGKLLSFALGPVFKQATHKLVDAFHQRARQCYG